MMIKMMMTMIEIIMIMHKNGINYQFIGDGELLYDVSLWYS